MNASLRIGRLRTTCDVASARFAPAVRERVSRACRDHVPIALRGAARWPDGDDESVWIVRRIDLSIVTRIDAAPDDIALSMVRALGCALAKALTGDGDGTNAIRFRNRAAYLSRFVADAAAGTAWTRWYFAPLAGWRLLPASTAIRSALLEDPAAGLEALGALDDRELENVVGCLTAKDERLVAGALAETDTDLMRPDAAMNAPGARHAQASASLFSLRPLMAHLRLVNRVPKSGTPEPDSPSVDDHAFTKFGGIVLLLRDVNALPWSAWTAGWPDPVDGVSADTCLKWLALAACSGCARADTVLADEVWRDVLGIPRTLLLRQVARWLRAVGHERRHTLALSVPPDGIAREERRWLAVSRRAGISRDWCAVLASLGRLAYTGFARRLPGFAKSSVDYLWRNFLDIDAVVEPEEDRVVVRCGRAPLHLVLALTGMTRGLVAGTDARGRPILVFSRD